MALKIQGMDELKLCPEWVRHFWDLTIGLRADREEYNEEEDLQIFVFDVNWDDRKACPELESKGIKLVKIWELPDGPIRYEAYTND